VGLGEVRIFNFPSKINTLFKIFQSTIIFLNSNFVEVVLGVARLCVVMLGFVRSRLVGLVLCGEDFNFPF
jgi:hypothetical protein